MYCEMYSMHYVMCSVHSAVFIVKSSVQYELEGTARYAGFTSSPCGGLRPPAEAFFALLAKKKAFYALLAYFRPFLVFSRNLSNF